MVSLEWRREQDMAFLPAGTPLRFGKKVVMRGVGYRSAGPSEFTLHRVPTRLVAWAIEQRGGSARWEVASRRATQSGAGVLEVWDSDPVVLAPAGFFHTHRWVFTDDQGHLSPLIRTTRFATLDARLKGGLRGVDASLSTKVETTVDPAIRIELSLPWDEGDWPRPQDIIEMEVDDLAEGRNEVPFFGELYEYLGPLFPAEVPPELRFDRFPVRLDMPGDASFSMEATVSPGERPFAFCYLALDSESGELLGSSPVSVIWRDTRGVVNLFG